MSLVFDSPQAAILPDDIHRNYGNVDNRVEFLTEDGTQFLTIAVPTWLFTFMAEVAGIDPQTDVTLSIEQMGKAYVFAMLAGDDLYDLWDYTYSTLPPCFREKLA